MATPMVSGFDQTAADPVEDKSIQALALLGGGEARISHRSRRAARKMSALTGTVPGQHIRRELEVLGQLHAHKLRGQEQEEGRIQLPALDRGRPLQQGREIDTEDVDDLNLCLIGANGAQRFQVPFARLCSEDRKSTRLNSSHMSISYAVFCLKKKKNKKHT